MEKLMIWLSIIPALVVTGLCIHIQVLRHKQKQAQDQFNNSIKGYMRELRAKRARIDVAPARVEIADPDSGKSLNSAADDQ